MLQYILICSSVRVSKFAILLLQFNLQNNNEAKQYAFEITFFLKHFVLFRSCFANKILRKD